jgi:signal transduction histidine kinase
VRVARSRWVGLGITAAVAVTLAVRPSGGLAGVWPELRPMASGVFLAVSWLSANNFRETRDPALLFVSVGSGALAIQSVLGELLPYAFVGNDFLSHHPTTGRVVFAASLYATMVGLLALAVCLMLAPPWRDRRGRRPLAPGVVVGVACIASVALDIGIAIARPLDVGNTVGPEKTIGVVTAVIALVATAHGYAKGFSYRWLVGSSSALILWGGSWLLLSQENELVVIGNSWLRVMPFVSALLLLVGVLATQRLDVSRMRRATDRADEVLGGRAEIASVISHDVRSPVSSIKSIAASTIANYDRLDDAQRLEFVGMIEREAQVALGIVHQMSVALRIDAGTLELVRRPTTIATVVRQAIDGSETDGRRIEVEAAPGVTANVDAKWLAEAIRQGLDNAAAFSPAESSIRVGVEDAGEGAAAITIQDEGPGIPPERRDEVFERFSRWRPQGYSDVPGSGLGLFICRGIVREHGGEITLENGAERGTILRILLPWSAD